MGKTISLYTYCVVGDDNRNKEVKIGSTAFVAWVEQYCRDLKLSFYEYDNDSLDIQRYYCDPDKTWGKEYNHAFHEKIVRFLNAQRANLSWFGRWNYEFLEGKGIQASEKKEEGKSVSFYLKSDQFGFSAPSNQKKHPYDFFIKKSNDKDTAIEKVAGWIATSRTIGGSFIWPKEIWRYYNLTRGGSVKGGSYIEDRVDLTLLELKHLLDSELKDRVNLLRNTMEKVSETVDVEWLSSMSFKEYVEVFCLEEFVDTENSYIPYDIVQSDFPDRKVILNEANEYTDRKKHTIFKLDENGLEKMLNNLSYLIEKRSEKIQRIIEKKQIDSEHMD